MSKPKQSNCKQTGEKRAREANRAQHRASTAAHCLRGGDRAPRAFLRAPSASAVCCGAARRPRPTTTDTRAQCVGHRTAGQRKSTSAAQGDIRGSQRVPHRGGGGGGGPPGVTGCKMATTSACFSLRASSSARWLRALAASGLAPF